MTYALHEGTAKHSSYEFENLKTENLCRAMVSMHVLVNAILTVLLIGCFMLLRLDLPQSQRPQNEEILDMLQKVARTSLRAKRHKSLAQSYEEAAFKAMGQSHALVALLMASN